MDDVERAIQSLLYTAPMTIRNRYDAIIDFLFKGYTPCSFHPTVLKKPYSEKFKVALANRIGEASHCGDSTKEELKKAVKLAFDDTDRALNYEENSVNRNCRWLPLPMWKGVTPIAPELYHVGEELLQFLETFNPSYSDYISFTRERYGYKPTRSQFNSAINRLKVYKQAISQFREEWRKCYESRDHLVNMLDKKEGE